LHRSAPSRRLLLLGALAGGLSASWIARADPANGGLTPDDKALIDKAAGYLEGLGQVKGRFEQTDSNGAVTHGDLYLSRPGKARFAYDPPFSLLVVSDGKTVWRSDPRLKTVNHIALKHTPLALFLADHVRLDQGVVVEHVERFSDGFTLFARDGHGWSQGRLALTFGQDPIRLREWSLTDAQGRTTRVRLTALTATAGLAPALFAGLGGSAEASTDTPDSAP